MFLIQLCYFQRGTTPKGWRRLEW